MSRIFDALRKAQTSRHQAPLASAGMSAASPANVPPVATPAPATLASVVGRAVSSPSPAFPHRGKPFVVPISTVPTLPIDVEREMTGLRVSLEATLLERIPRVVMFTSAQGGEGTTTVASQFALSLARDGRMRFLLADLHARRPSISRGFESAAAGAEGSAIPLDGKNRGLDVLPLPEAYRSAGLIGPTDARDILDALSGDYDWVILDGPPVLESPDAAALGALADGVVVVVQAGRTKRPVLVRSVDLLRKAGARVVGSVLNRRRLEIPEFIYRRI